MAGKTRDRSSPDETLAMARRHLRLGWWSLLVFLAIGAVLEVMLGLKVQFYLNAANDTRRLLWRLGHAHGTLLSLVNIAFALGLPHLRTWSGGSRVFASRCLIGATLLLPGGFLLGGVIVEGGDPTPLIFLVPVGALILFVGIFLTARASARAFDE